MSLSARLDAVSALFAGPFVAGLLLLIVFGTAFVARAEHRARAAREARRRRAAAINAHLTHLPR